MFVNPRAVGTTGNRADETWRAGWPESADLFWAFVAAPWQQLKLVLFSSPCVPVPGIRNLFFQMSIGLPSSLW